MVDYLKNLNSYAIFDNGTWVYKPPIQIVNLHLNFVSYGPFEWIEVIVVQQTQKIEDYEVKKIMVQWS